MRLTPFVWTDWFDSLHLNFYQSPPGKLGVHANKDHKCEYFEIPLAWKDQPDFFTRLHERALEAWAHPEIDRMGKCPVCGRSYFGFHFRYHGKYFCRTCGSYYKIARHKPVVLLSIKDRAPFLDLPPVTPPVWNSLYLVFHVRFERQVECRIGINGWMPQTFMLPQTILQPPKMWAELYSQVIPPEGKAKQQCPCCGMTRPTFLRSHSGYWFCGYCGAHLEFVDGEIKARAIIE